MNEAELGSFLFILPVCSLIGLPISGWLISKYDSRYLLISGFLIYIFSLLGIGYASNIQSLTVVVCFFLLLDYAPLTFDEYQAIQLQKRHTGEL